jgi:hypothetical protein
LTIGFLKDGVSWNTVGPFVGPATALLEGRVNDLWTTSPHGAILAAKKFGATAETKQLDGQSFSTLSFTVPRKMSAVVWVNSAGFVTKIDSKVPDAMLADMDVVTQPARGMNASEMNTASSFGDEPGGGGFDGAGIYFLWGSYWFWVWRRRHASNRANPGRQDVLLSSLRSTLFGDVLAAFQE